MRFNITILVIMFCVGSLYADNKTNGLISALEETLEAKLGECTDIVVKWLEDFNDKHLGTSEVGRLLSYDKIKPKIAESARTGDGKGLKKMSMSMMPLIFHVGATSTWMLLTTLMAAKSVAIGLLLLVFKIAVSSAKVASFFTLLKSKSSHQHGGWWAPHVEHGHKRSFRKTFNDHQPLFQDWHSYNPSWTPHETHAATIPQYKTLDHYGED